MTAPVRSARAALSVLYRVLLRSQVSVGRLAGLAALGIGGIVVGTAIGASDPVDPIDSAVGFVNGFGLSLFAPVTALVFASAALGDPIDDGTLVYLWLRPVQRWRLAVAAFLASLTIALPIVVVPVTIAALAASSDLDVTGAAALASAVGVVGYCGLFTFLGVRVRRSLPWGLAYVLLWEGFVALAGESAGRLAVRSYTRSILSELTDVRLRLADTSLGAAIVVPILVAGVAVALTARRLDRMDVA